MAGYSIPAQKLTPTLATVYQFAVLITPTDNTQIGPYFGLWVGGGGNVTVCMRNGDGQGGTTTVQFKNVPAGTFLPIAFQGVENTGTDATNLLGLG